MSGSTTSLSDQTHMPFGYKIEYIHAVLSMEQRLVAMRNWSHTGSHFAAENIAFMYLLYESCKLNHVNYREYVEYILNRIMLGEEIDENHLPNHYLNTTQSVTEKVLG
ncbi:hypothetical protein [Parabacteroides sp.]|uniref:hypothetical protein n=1 Tax=Parabacteroides sp. TaxID=1869337 RepID=UPI0026DFCCA8|nr:hypothetical protein [Parabacteroides sp.]MDO5430486.1 hypothetical protein [Parabacteroides sp.]